MKRSIVAFACAAGLSLGTNGAVASGVDKLPITCLIRIDGPDSKAVYASCDRRFIFRGEMIDLWTGAAPSYERGHLFNLNRNDFKPDEFSFTFLSPQKKLATAYVYAALDSKASVEYLKALRATPPTETEVRVVLVSSLNNASRRMNEAVWCSADRVEATFAAFGKAEHQSQLQPECDISGLMMAQASTYLFGISRLPLTIMSNGKSFYGIPIQIPETFEEMSK